MNDSVANLRGNPSQATGDFAFPTLILQPPLFTVMRATVATLRP